jgi:hypothetical protein
MGQPGLVEALLITLIIVKEGSKLKSLILSILVSIKSFFLFSLISFFRKKPKVFFLTLFFLMLLATLSFVFIRPEWFSYYFGSKFTGIISISSGTVNNLDYYNQSLRSTLNRLSLTGLYPGLEIISLLLFGLIIFPRSNFLLSIPVILILSPVSWQHYFVVLFPILVISFLSVKKSNLYILLAFSTFLWWIEFPSLHASKVNLINGVIASHYFISALILSIIVIKENLQPKK